VKRVAAPLLNEATYSVLQAAAMGWDIHRGTWFEDEIDFAKRVISPGDTALDIGANFGLWAHHLSRAVGPSGHVHSFEPIPFTARTFRVLSHVLRFAKNTELHEVGCGETNERVVFKVPVMNTGAISAGLVHMGRNDDRPGREVFARFPKTKDVPCRVVRIDDHLPDLQRVSFIKCDIEGADLFALRGAKQTIAQHKPALVVEITPWFLEGFGTKVEDLTGFMRDLGYRAYRYQKGALVPTTDENIVEANWLFLHDEAHSALIA